MPLTTNNALHFTLATGEECFTMEEGLSILSPVSFYDHHISLFSEYKGILAYKEELHKQLDIAIETIAAKEKKLLLAT